MCPSLDALPGPGRPARALAAPARLAPGVCGLASRGSNALARDDVARGPSRARPLTGLYTMEPPRILRGLSPAASLAGRLAVIPAAAASPRGGKSGEVGASVPRPLEPPAACLGRRSSRRLRHPAPEGSSLGGSLDRDQSQPCL